MKTLFLLLLLKFSVQPALEVRYEIPYVGQSVQVNVQPYPKVYVEWVDIIATDSGWHDKEDIDYWLKHENDTVKQTGFLYKETPSHIVLVDSFISTTYLGAATKIPKGNVIKIVRY